MGYTTKFDGEFKFSRGLSGREAFQLYSFSTIRHEEKGCPSIWCDWVPNREGTALVWNDDTEKFYKYVEWLQYLIDNYFTNWGIKLNGEMIYQGELAGDCGVIVVEDNIITKIPLSKLLKERSIK